jgi:hypothetical protein
MRITLAVLLFFTFVGCKKNTSMSVEVTGTWRGIEMLNPPGQHTGVFVPVPEGSGYFAEFSFGGEFRGHYHFLDGWQQYQVWPETRQATLYKNEKNDSMRIGFEINQRSTELILTFPSYEVSKLKLVR